MSETDTGDIEDLADVFKALGNEARIAVLLTLEKGKPVSQLTDELDITRSGLQKNIERLIDANLVYRPIESDETYALTTLGNYFVNEIHEEKEHVDQVLNDFRTRLNKLREAEQETLERMEEAGVDTKELENKLRAEAWEDVEAEDDSQIDTEAEALGPTTQLQADKNRDPLDSNSSDESNEADEDNLDS